MNAKSTKFGLERATNNRRAGVWTILGLLLVPLVVAGGFLWAGWNSTDRLDRVQAAIVNQDKPIKLDGQLVPLGRQLSGGLAANSDDPNFDWVITNAEDAKAGLGSGRYAAVVTIPENFTARATSFSKDKASQISPAVIDVQTSQISGLADPVVGQAITASATKVVNATLTENYLKNIYLGFNETGKQFGTLANAAGDLSDGTDKLADGIGKSADGTDKFANGLVKLGYGAEQLADGLGATNKGAAKLADGMDTLAANTADLPKQSRQLADGVAKGASGAKKLSTGATQLSGGLDQLSTGVHTYAKGAGAYAQGSKKFAQGTEQLANGADKYATGVGQYADGLATYAKGTSEYAKGATQYQAGVKEYSDNTQKFASGLTGLQQGMTTLAADAIPCPDSIPAEACPAFQNGVRAGAGAALQGLGTEEAPGLALAGQQLAIGSKSLVQGSSGLATGANELTTGSAKLSKGATQLSQGAAGLAKGSSTVNENAERLATGAQGLAKGAKKIDWGLEKLNTGAGGLATGLAQLAPGIGKAADGADQFADGIAKLTPGIDKLAGGVRGLATGIDKLDAGASGLADGAQQSADGGQKLSSGLGKLTKGGDKLATGTDKFATGLEKGKDKVPSFSKSLRETLSSVVTTPVRSDAARTIFPDAASTTLLMVLALWLSGLATFLILRALPSRILSSMKPSWRLALAGVLPAAAVGVVQAGVLTAVLSALLDLDAGQVGALTALALLAAVTFAVLNHALVAWLGGVGRFISVVVVVIAAAGAITSALPQAFDTLTPLLPTTPALDGLRAIVTGGSGTGNAAALLVAWLIAGLVASIVAVARRRMLVAANPARTLAAQG